MANATNVNRPDFAYPKTVSTDAHRDLKAAVECHNAPDAINALIRIEIAESLIDNTSIAETIRLAESTAAKFADSRMSGIFDVLIAKMYVDAYNQDRWVYNSRNLPLEPLPADITEWSGNQYKAKIMSLCDKSISPASIDALRDFDILDYAGIVTADSLTAVFYPKLSDFALSQAIQMLESISAYGKVYKIYKLALDSNADNVPSQILWQTKIDIYDFGNDLEDVEEVEVSDEDCYADNDDNPEVSDKTKDKAKLLLSVYGRYSHNPYSSYILDQCYGYLTDLDLKARYIEIAEKYLDTYPDNPFSNNIRNNVSRIKQRSVRLTFPGYCGINSPFDVEVYDENTTDFAVNAYFVSEDAKGRGFDRDDLVKRVIASSTPTSSIPIRCDMPLPFAHTTKVTMQLERPGYYIIVAETNKGEKRFVDNALSYIRCIPVMPTVTNTVDSLSMVTTVDPISGAPIANAKVKVKNDRKGSIIFNGKSNDKGITNIFLNTYGTPLYLTVGIDGKDYDFQNLRIAPKNTKVFERTTYNADILTNRALYHPGDEIEVLGVFYSVHSVQRKQVDRKLVENTRVRYELLNANYKVIDTIECTTDDYGRAVCTFNTPTDGLTGRFTVRAFIDGQNDLISSTSVMVSDYVMPDYEVTVAAIECDTPEQGAVTIRGEARSYSGMPMAGIKIDVGIMKSQMWRLSWDSTPIYSTEVTTDDDGRYSCVVPPDIFKKNQAWFYLASVEAVSSTGSTAETTKQFALNKKYNITLSVSQTVDGEVPLCPQVRVIDSEGSLAEIPMVWELRTHDTDQLVAGGDYYGKIDIANVRPGSYKLCIAPVVKDLANTASQSITIYNVASGIVPDNQILWVKDTKASVDADGMTRIFVGTGSEETWLYYTVDADGSIINTQVMKYGYGYHTIVIDASIAFDEFNVRLFCVKDCNIYDKTCSVVKTKQTNLKIIGDSFRDNLIPNGHETWNLRVVKADGTPIPAAMAFDMYNKALEALVAHSFRLRLNGNLNTYGRYIDFGHLYIGNSYNYFNEALISLKVTSLASPTFNCYGFVEDYSHPYAVRFDRMSIRRMQKNMSADDGLGVEAELCCDNAFIESSGAASDEDIVCTGDMAVRSADPEASERDDDFDYREADVPMAVWAPSLTTDAEGNIRYTFTVPNANTTWRLQAVAWSKELMTGYLMHDFVASKPVMVTPNLPRFMRSGDKAVILASVMNNSDSTSVVTTVVEIFNPVTGEVTKKHVSTDTIDPKKSIVVPIDINAGSDMTAIGYRIRSGNGDFADGEQNVIRILSSQASLIETTPFYLNPGDKAYSTQLPKEQGARISLTFSENPAWSIVTALPGLRTSIDDYANSAAAALYSAAIVQGITRCNPDIKIAIDAWLSNPTDSALVSMLEKNEDLKLAVLNSTPWVQAAQSQTERMGNLAMIFNENETNASIAEAIKILTKLQKNDGGWAWGSWCNESSVWVTSNVLAMLGNLKYLGWLPNDTKINSMIKQAVKYYDNEVEDTDIIYALTRPLFSDLAMNANGKQVMTATIKLIKKNWKDYTSPSYKAMAAEALWLNGEKPLAKELMRSVSEFGVYSKTQGLKFPSVNALYHYAILLEAYAMINPDSKEVDGLRQQLIVRKQATDWGDAVVTTEVVRSILLSGANWLVPAQGADITVGSTRIEPTSAIETATGNLRANLSEYAGETLCITTTGVGPAYGAVYAQFERQMDKVEAYCCDDLDIEKTLLIRKGSEWTHWMPDDTLHVGDRVRVQLTIHCKRNLQYVCIEDDRPATFAPVEQLPGWEWSGGCGFYRENRDSRTDLHVIYMSPGTYLLNYDMNVNLAGTFSSGVATIQSQYAPEISAHSSGCIIQVD